MAQIKKSILASLAMLALSMIFSGCDRLHGMTSRNWREDVVLDTGEVITVKRSVTIHETNSLGGDAYNAVETEVELSFTGTLAHLPQWNVPLRAQVIYRDVQANEWVIVANSTSCGVYADRGNPRYLYAEGRPQTAYFEFRLRNGRWMQTPLSAASIGRETNLLSRPPKKSSTHYVRFGPKVSPPAAPELLRVIERPEIHCLQTTVTQAVWAAEDRALAALDRLHATSEQAKRVGELLASTRFVEIIPDAKSRWSQDTDTGTVEIMNVPVANQDKVGVSADGQVIYRAIAADYQNQIAESYSRRLTAAGLGEFAK